MPTDVTDTLSSRALVLGMVDADGTIRAAELYGVAEACGFTIHQIRLCLARLVHEGLFVQEGRGRKAVLRATAKGTRQLDSEPEFLRLAWMHSAGFVDWDGIWHLVGFTVEEERRQARNSLREYLVGVLGGAPLAGGLYVSANDWDDLVRGTAEELGVGDRVFLAQSTHLEVGGRSDPREIARELWDLDQVGGAWRDFIETYRDQVDLDDDEAADPLEALADAVKLISDFDRIIHTDPLLPPALQPADWPGTEALQVLVRGTDRIRSIQEERKLPAVFRRFDAVMADVARHSRDRDR